MDKNEEKGFIYLVGDWERENFFKIGVTKGTIDRRIKKLQTGNASEIFVCSYFQTSHPFLLEKELHLRYASRRLNGEWFELSPEEASAFKKTCEELEEMNESLKSNYHFRKKYKLD